MLFENRTNEIERRFSDYGVKVIDGRDMMYLLTMIRRLEQEVAKLRRPSEAAQA